MQSVYELKRIKNSSDRGLTKALHIYSQNIDPLIRTDTREIIFWLDRYNQKFPDQFYIVSLVLNDLIVGYGQFVFFREEKLIFIDYLAIDKAHRKNNTFYEFIEKIKEFLIEQGIAYNYVIAEVGYYKENNIPTEVTRNLIRLLKMSGFGVIKMNYFQPMLGRQNFETEIDTILMLYTDNDIKRIKKETFLLFIETIYFKHYKRWYDQLLTEQEQVIYIKRLSDLKEKIETAAKKKEFIEINGYANLFVTGEATAKPQNYIKIAKAIGAVIVFLVFSVVIGSIIVFVKKHYGLDQENIKFTALISLSLLIFIILIFYRKNNDSLTDIIEKVIKMFAK